MAWNAAVQVPSLVGSERHGEEDDDEEDEHQGALLTSFRDPRASFSEIGGAKTIIWHLWTG